MKEKKHSWKDAKFISQLIFSLQSNLVSITSTDTILGLLGNITKESFNLITKIKGKRNDKPFLILVSSYEKIFNFIDKKRLNKNIEQLLKKSWPGPLTVIFNAKSNLPKYLKSKTDSIAIRCPDHKELQQILSHFDGLLSTSANKSGEPFPKKISDIDSELIKQITYIVIDSNKSLINIDRTNKFNQTFPSTIIDTTIANIDGTDTKTATIKLLRKGAYSVEELESYYGKKFI